MFDIGFWELVLIGVVALVVIGPERLPGVARTAGLWFGRARRFVLEVKADIDRELHLEEVERLARRAESSELHDIIERSVGDAVSGARREAGGPAPEDRGPDEPAAGPGAGESR